ncbi:dihydroxyacetone kinase subunit DhaK [Salinisphaera sp. LB1]|uniref:dihydroxyacetone kinase subunit DhaK n=1 Tax=Salinisphaera sp. LB1 TaxID=2183911 RepID=UPI000D706873|nr:dihydroxyacetone kinase subunit DhaK [Salinisphaera sp. LB1]AWN14928.1 Dihydroxyacetone kinase, ATP-dependent [Salinisphaera sp. LB1]
MDFFFNAADDVVDDGLSGLARIAPVRVSERASGMRLIVDRDFDNSRVAVVSGGGAGHEPAHAGFVGHGMLAAAIAGDLFTSPSVEAVLAAIREVTGPAGCLLVIKNYTGDRLNFGLAAERAAREGYTVRSVIVADDISLPANVGARGLAGTVLVHKIAGHHAAAGADLDTVARAAQTTIDGLVSIGLSLSSATLPGGKREPRSPELGLGIHNEPGVREVAPENAADAVRLALEPLIEAAEARHGGDARWVVLINNLGGCSTQEMAVLSDEVLARLPADRVRAAVVPAPVMSSMNMHGFSITLLPIDDDVRAALASPVAAIGWPGLCDVAAPETFVPTVSEHKAPGAGGRDSARADRIRAATDALSAARAELDDLDAAAGDGDTGTAFNRGGTAIRGALDDDRLSTGEPALLADEIGDLLARDMGGSSGVLLSILFTATAAALRDGNAFGAALAAGIGRMQDYGSARPGDRTMLDALVPAAQALADGGSLGDAAQAARAGADATADMGHAGAGRAAYVRDEALTGVVDPGAEAVARVFEALAG